jgi:hypothetical protein
MKRHIVAFEWGWASQFFVSHIEQPFHWSKGENPMRQATVQSHRSLEGKVRALASPSNVWHCQKLVLGIHEAQWMLRNTWLQQLVWGSIKVVSAEPSATTLRPSAALGGAGRSIAMWSSGVRKRLDPWNPQNRAHDLDMLAVKVGSCGLEMIF